MLTKWLLLIVSLVFNTIGIFSHVNASKDKVKLWAVLVAGSNYYYNYRHQADICHAYQILHKHGIPDEQIIVFMTDDIAYNDLNPTPGIIINHPNGNDVYKGVVKDYVGKDVTSKNFLNVLLGKSELLQGIGSGKVLKSGPDDHVFINFVDHGSPGVLCFPNDFLYASDFISTLKTMYQKKMFNKMVLYVDACESGSVFENHLPNNISIYVTTAAKSDEPSYACYKDPDRNVYLADTYSAKWMEDSDSEDLSKETLQTQFMIVKTETDQSHPQQYGDLSISKMTVSEFQGRTTLPKLKKVQRNITDAVPSYEVPMEILRQRLRTAKLIGRFQDITRIQKQIFKLESNRRFLLEKVNEVIRCAVIKPDLISQVSQERLSLKDLQCHKDVISYFSENCFNLSKNDYALRYVYIFVNMCEMGIKPKVMKTVMDYVCTHPPVYGIV